MRLFITAFIILFAALPAKAQVMDTILTLPEGHAILNITATESIEVERDTLVATLAYTETGTSAADIQNVINTQMANALDLIKKEDNVKVETGGYYVHETTHPVTKAKQWKGQQSVTIESTDADIILELSGTIQEMGFRTSGLQYVLDQNVAAEHKDKLMEAALAKLESRALRAAKALGKSQAELKDINVSSDMPPIMYNKSYARMETMAMASDRAAPVAEAGEDTITLTVSARALLKP